jgi:hypothetical protein
MNREESDRLRELCTLAQNEMDPEKLVRLIREINQVFEVSEEREKQASEQHRDPGLGGGPSPKGES